MGPDCFVHIVAVHGLDRRRWLPTCLFVKFIIYKYIIIYKKYNIYSVLRAVTILGHQVSVEAGLQFSRTICYLFQWVGRHSVITVVSVRRPGHQPIAGDRKSVV